MLFSHTLSHVTVPAAREQPLAFCTTPIAVSNILRFTFFTVVLFDLLRDLHSHFMPFLVVLLPRCQINGTAITIQAATTNHFIHFFTHLNIITFSPAVFYRLLRWYRPSYPGRTSLLRILCPARQVFSSSFHLLSTRHMRR